MSQHAIAQRVFGYAETTETRAVDKAMSTLRAKVEIDRRTPEHLLTRRGQGYVFVPLKTVEPAPFEPESTRNVVRRVPAMRDPFVGRGSERARLIETVTHHRLVSLIGPGGVGKTRLAVQTALDHPGPWPGGVQFCDLTEARSEAEVFRVLARSLQLVLDEDPAGLIAFALASRERQLLVLDNVEQIADVMRPLVVRWTEAAAQLHLLLTSREDLDLPAERRVVLDPMEEGDAKALYLQAATAVGAPTDLSEQDLAVLPELMERLDRLPLAIELAAARVRLLPPARLLPRLGNRFDVLTRRRTAHRHDSLGATLQWSWALLRPTAQVALAQLSVFDGGFSLEAAEAVLDHPAALDLLQELVDRSWVQQVGADRYGLLVSVQAYVKEHEIDLGSAEERHGNYFARLGRGLIEGAPPTSLKRKILVDIDNVLTALRRAIARRDLGVAFETLVAAWVSFTRTGPYAAWETLADEVCRTFELGPTQHAEVTARWSYTLRSTGRIEASQAIIAPAMEAVRRGTLVGLTAVRVRMQHGRLLHWAGQLDEGAREFDLCLEEVRRLGLRSLEAVVLRGIGLLNAERSRFDAARPAYEEALSIALDLEDQGSEAWARCKLGILAYHQRRFEAALAELNAALRLAKALGHRELEAEALRHLGGLHEDIGPPERTIAYRERALALALSIGNRSMSSSIRVSLARAFTGTGDLAQARAHIEPVLASLHRLHSAGIAARAHLVAGDLATALRDFDDADRHYRFAVDTCRDAGFRILEGTALTSWARSQIADGQWDGVQITITAAEALVDSVDDPELARVVRELRSMIA